MKEVTPATAWPGTRVKLTKPVHWFGRIVAQAGEFAKVVYMSGASHATSNGGGWDVRIEFDDHRKFDNFKQPYETNEAGEFLLIEQADASVIVRSTTLTIVERS